MRSTLVGGLTALFIAQAASIASSQEDGAPSSVQARNRQAHDGVERGSENAKSFWARGRSLCEKRDYQAGLLELDKAIAREREEKGKPGFDSLFAAIYSQRAMAHVGLRDFEGAIEDFEKAFQLGPPTAKELCARSYSFDKLGKSKDARQDLFEAIRVDPRLPDAYIQLACLLKHEGELDNAIKQLTEGLRQCGPEKWLLTLRAQAYLARRDFLAAASDLDKVIELTPDDTNAYLTLAEIHEALGDTDRAKADFDRAVEVSSGDRSVLSRRASFLQKHGMTAKALADLDRIDPQDAYSYANRAGLYEALGEIDRAAADFDHAIELAPQDPVLPQNRALLLYLLYERAHFFQKHGMADRALADFTALIQADPKSFRCYIDRAKFFAEQGKHRDAIADLSNAIEIDPTQHEAFSVRAAAFLEIQQPARAMDDFNQAILLTPADPFKYLARAKLLKSLGRAKEAEQDVLRAKELAGITDQNSAAH